MAANSVRFYFLFAAARTAIERDQLALLNIKLFLFVDFPLVVIVPA
ncbi:MAG: hypothetical protein AB8C02_12635 [Halioglobus sp.]